MALLYSLVARGEFQCSVWLLPNSVILLQMELFLESTLMRLEIFKRLRESCYPGFQQPPQEYPISMMSEKTILQVV